MAQEHSESAVDRDVMRRIATDCKLIEVRRDLAQFTSATFAQAGELLHAFGHIVGSDRVEGRSPFGHGSDDTVAVSLLLRIASELVSASNDLFADGRHYAASALLRQLVEIEYLAWAFETRDQDGEQWLRSTKAERQSFFTPAKLRKAADGRFRSVDCGFHCELGGHPVPRGTILLHDDLAVAQLMLSDLLGHTGRIWDHVAAWVKSDSLRLASFGDHVYALNQEMVRRYSLWKAADSLGTLPPP
jgi:hypothetical protein